MHLYSLHGQHSELCREQPSARALRDCLQPGTVDAWRADWDMNLTPEEVEVVRNPTYRAALLLARLPGDAA